MQMDIHKIFESADHLLAACGIAVAGVWAYYNFVRSRTYRPRSELSVSGRIFGSPMCSYLVPKVTLKNTGMSRLKLKQIGSGIRVSHCAQQPEIPLHPIAWSEAGPVYSMFEHHFWIEPGETIADEQHVIPLPSSYIAVKVELRLCIQTRRFPKRNIEINANAVIYPDSIDSRRYGTEG